MAIKTSTKDPTYEREKPMKEWPKPDYCGQKQYHPIRYGDPVYSGLYFQHIWVDGFIFYG